MGYRYQNDENMDASTNRIMVWGAILFAAFVLAFPLYRFVEPAARSEARARQQASLEAEGMDLFSLNCTACHGANGEGGVGPALNSKQFLQAVTDKQAELFISVGVPGSAMGAYSQDFGGPLTSEQIRALAAYLRSLEKDAPDVPNWRNPLG